MGVNRQSIKVIINVITSFRHHICINHGISQNFCGNNREKLAGNGQENLFAGTACRDQSCRAFKELEENTGITYQQPISRKEIKQAAIGFVDDIDFYENRETGLNNMQQMLAEYNTYYKTTGGKISIDKMSFSTGNRR